MKKPLLILIFLVLLACLIGTVSASGPFMVNPLNNSAEQLGGLYNAYHFANGDDTFEVFTAVPLTVQNTAYPLEFWYAAWWLSWACLILGILMTAFKDRVPSMAIMSFGLLAWGGFLICAFMLPYTASLLVDVQILQNVDKAGVPVGNNSIYITQVADYRASTPHAYICWGLSIAGFVEFILGVLSLIGWFQRRGLSLAAQGVYVETESGSEDTYRGVGKKYNNS